MIPAVELAGLSKRFGSRTAVDHLSMTVKQGEILALLGQNGAGKTTTVRMLSGLTRPSEGDALLAGYSSRREAGQAKRLLNLSPQETAVACRLSVRENLELMARLYGSGRAAAAERARQLMQALGLRERAEDRAGKLSGGLQRRLSIAMALITEPQVLFLEEPPRGLDVRARRELWKLVGTLRGTVTVILTTHYLEEAEYLADRIAILEDGRLQALGTAEELKAQTGCRNLEETFLSLTGGGGGIS